MSLQDNLRTLRERAGYTQAKDFAENVLNMSYSTYMGYETRGTWPSEETLVKIADALHVTTDELLGYKISEFSKAKKILIENDFDVHEKTINSEYVTIHHTFKVNGTGKPREREIIKTTMSKSAVLSMVRIADSMTDFDRYTALKKYLHILFMEYYIHHESTERSADNE